MTGAIVTNASNVACISSCGYPLPSSYNNGGSCGSLVTINGCVYYPSYVAQPATQNTQPQVILYTKQEDTQWVERTLGPLGWFAIEVSIAILIVAIAKGFYDFVKSEFK